MTNIFKIHPSIGISRLGDSTAAFCLAPETALGLPVECDSHGCALLDDQGNERPIDMFKDSQGRIKRQAARFRVYVYQDANDKAGRELKIGDYVEVYKRQTGENYRAVVLDIEWTVYLANKKASWYQLKESGDVSLRNATITDATARQRLIIDPGPQTVSFSNGHRSRAEFAKDKNSAFPQSFPPTLSPKSIERLGAIMVHQQGDYNRLVVLGGHGHSGSFKSHFGQPRFENHANNDGWFDDVSDGPVTANLWLQHLLDDGGAEDDLSPFMLPVDDPAWVLVSYPGYVPEIENMITIDDIVYDLALREMDYNPEIYGSLCKDKEKISSAKAQPKDWNKDYCPYFYRDIWPILCRPNVYQWLMVFNLTDRADPYSITPDAHGNFDFDVISVPPYKGQDLAECEANAAKRQYVYGILRRPGPENLFHTSAKEKANQPLLDGRAHETPAPSRFLRFTDTQLFFLQQWVDGKFVNEKREGLPRQIESAFANGADLDHGVLRSALEGAFCLGKEVCSVIRDPAIYAKPYRIKHAPYEPGLLRQPGAFAAFDAASDFSLGLEPGDLTKFSALPWQADFNESTGQDVDITYEGWANSLAAGTIIPLPTDVEKGVFWWAAHRPMEVFLPMSTPFGNSARNQLPWTHAQSRSVADELKAVNAWVTLGFIRVADSSEGTELVELVGKDATDNLIFISEHHAQ